MKLRKVRRIGKDQHKQPKPQGRSCHTHLLTTWPEVARMSVPMQTLYDLYSCGIRLISSSLNTMLLWNEGPPQRPPNIKKNPHCFLLVPIAGKRFPSTQRPQKTAASKTLRECDFDPWAIERMFSRKIIRASMTRRPSGCSRTSLQVFSPKPLEASSGRAGIVFKRPSVASVREYALNIH